jgi:hypothetical protein
VTAQLSNGQEERKEKETMETQGVICPNSPSSRDCYNDRGARVGDPDRQCRRSRRCDEAQSATKEKENGTDCFCLRRRVDQPRGLYKHKA